MDIVLLHILGIKHCDRNDINKILIEDVWFSSMHLDLNCFENLSEINPYLYEFGGEHSMLYHSNMTHSMKRHYDDIDQYLLNYNHQWVGLQVIMKQLNGTFLASQ